MSKLALELIAKEKNEKTGYLDLGRCGLTPDNPQLPEVWKALGELTHLETLILSNEWYDWEKRKWINSQNEGAKNLLEKIPPIFHLLIHLKKLVICGDGYDETWGISKLEGLGGLISLQYFDISSNQIPKLEDLDMLTKLQHFDISYNQISKLKGLEALTNRLVT